MSKRSSTKEGRKERKKEFVWTDDEAELLLNVANEYKVVKASESVDWESIKSKYEDITDRFIAALPNEPVFQKDFPHSKESITKQIVSSKLKSIRLKFRQAVDSGRRSGHGRVVMIYYELCEKLWGGSPATEQIEGGIESSELQSNVPGQVEKDKTSNLNELVINDHNGAGTSATIDNTAGDDIGDDDNESPITDAVIPPFEDNEDDSEQEDADVVSKETTKQRRSLLDDKLKNYKQEKMKRKLPLDTQILGCAQEELQIKKRLLDDLDKMESKYEESMERMSRNMEKLTDCITNGFGMLQQMMMNQMQMPTAGIYRPTPLPFHPYTQSPSSPYDGRMSSYPSSANTEFEGSSSPSSPGF